MTGLTGKWNGVPFKAILKDGKLNLKTNSETRMSIIGIDFIKGIPEGKVLRVTIEMEDADKR
jgi:hypothetical protein